MFRISLCVFLCGLLAAHPAAALTAEQLSQKATQIPVGSIVNIKLMKGRAKGQLLSVDSMGVVVRGTDPQGLVVEQTIAFSEMKDIRWQNQPNTTKSTLIAIGVVWLVLAGIGLLIGG